MLERQQIAEMGKWSGFVGIITIIGGVLSCISIIGIIPGVISIILGLRLKNVQRFANEAASSQDEMLQNSRLNMMFSDLSSFFKIQGILIIIGLVLAVILIVVAIIAGSFFFSELNYNNFY